MQNATIRNRMVPLSDRDDGLYVVEPEIASLIDRARTSIKLIEAAQARQGTAEAELADVVVPDDIAPLYAQARAALAACNASLGTALQFLIASTAAAPRA